MQLNHNRNYNLDLMKLLACMAVVGLHTLQKDLSIINVSMYYMCGFAVPIFFMSSGYILLNRIGSTPPPILYKENLQYFQGSYILVCFILFGAFYHGLYKTRFG